MPRGPRGPFKNADGIWCERFTSPPNAQKLTKRFYVQCKAEYNSKEALAELVRQTIKRYVDGHFTTRDTFESYVREKFLVEYCAAKNLQKSSRESLLYLFEGIVFPAREEGCAAFGNVPLGAIDTRTLSRLVATLQGKQKTLKMTGEVKRAYSDQTIRLAMIAVKSVFSWAKKNKDLSAVPEMEVPRVVKAQKPRPYSPEEALALVHTARTPAERLMFVLMFDAGLRTSEVLGLQPEQIDFTAHILTADRQLYRGLAKKHTKGKRIRHIEMSAELEAALKEVLANRIGIKYVLEDEAGRPFNAWWPRWLFERGCRAARIELRRVHDSRHSYASTRTTLGTDPFKLQRLLGHADIRTTMEYVHQAVAEQPVSIMSVGGAPPAPESLAWIRTNSRAVTAARKAKAG